MARARGLFWLGLAAAAANLAFTCDAAPPSEIGFPDPADVELSALKAAPPHQDIRPPSKYNTFREDRAIQKYASSGETDPLPEPVLELIRREARTVEILFPRSVDLRTFDLDAHAKLYDSRIGAAEEDARPLASYVEPDSVRFTRTRFSARSSEGGCELGGEDQTCDTLLFTLVDSPEVFPPGTDVFFAFSGFDVYVEQEDCSFVSEPAGDEDLYIGLSIRDEGDDAPELRSYSLRLPGEGGELDGLLELGHSTTSSIGVDGVPAPEYYVAPRRTIRGLFTTPPARLNIHAEIGDRIFDSPRDLAEMQALGYALVGPTGDPFEPGVDAEVAFVPTVPFGDVAEPTWFPGTPFFSFEIVSDDLFTELGTPRRFDLGAPTQSASGTGFVQRVGTTGDLPTTDITSFTIAHVRVTRMVNNGFGGLPGTPKTIVVEGDDLTSGGDPLVIAGRDLHILYDYVQDPAIARREVASVEVAVRDAVNPIDVPEIIHAEPVERVALCDGLAICQGVATFRSTLLGDGTREVWLTGLNADGHRLGSDRFVLEVALDTDGDGALNQEDVCAGFDDFGPDADGDTIPDACDACDAGDDRWDADSDGVADDCDNCPSNWNPAQIDTDGDGAGRACELDDDNDCRDDTVDADPTDPNTCGDFEGDGCDDCSQLVDGFGPGCELDMRNDGPNADGDWLCDPGDPCPFDPLNDSDGDGVCGDVDNCPTVANADQRDTMPAGGDGVGDACGDRDGDGVLDVVDNCPFDPNADQLDADGDAVGDACDTESADPSACGLDTDGDGCDDCDTPAGGFDPTVDGTDTDGDGVCARRDTDDLDPLRCGDADGDACDDCASGGFDPAADGTDADGDGICDARDVRDADPSLCGLDTDGDGCDDCASGRFAPYNDGSDTDRDGACDAGDVDDSDPTACGLDADRDGCDDCTSGLADTERDGTDVDGDGVCAIGDENDCNPWVCGLDADRDGCDDCAASFRNPRRDGTDADLDGVCGAGDLDDTDATVCGIDRDADGFDDCASGVLNPYDDGPDADEDGVAEPVDPSPTATVCGVDIDGDGCDDCAGGYFRPERDGPDADGDGACAASDTDDDPATGATVCGLDTDGDGCDDCSAGWLDPERDGPDADGDGLCDDGDSDADDDGVLPPDDACPLDSDKTAPGTRGCGLEEPATVTVAAGTDATLSVTGATLYVPADAVEDGITFALTTTPVEATDYPLASCASLYPVGSVLSVEASDAQPTAEPLRLILDVPDGPRAVLAEQKVEGGVVSEGRTDRAWSTTMTGIEPGRVAPFALSATAARTSVVLVSHPAARQQPAPSAAPAPAAPALRPAHPTTLAAPGPVDPWPRAASANLATVDWLAFCDNRHASACDEAALNDLAGRMKAKSEQLAGPGFGYPTAYLELVPKRWAAPWIDTARGANTFVGTSFYPLEATEEPVARVHVRDLEAEAGPYACGVYDTENAQLAMDDDCYTVSSELHDNTETHELFHAVQRDIAYAAWKSQWIKEGTATAVAITALDPDADPSARLLWRKGGEWRNWEEALKVWQHPLYPLETLQDVPQHKTAELFFHMGGGTIDYIHPMLVSLGLLGPPRLGVGVWVDDTNSYPYVQEVLPLAGVPDALEQSYVDLIVDRNASLGYPDEYAHALGCLDGVPCPDGAPIDVEPMAAPRYEVELSGGELSCPLGSYPEVGEQTITLVVDAGDPSKLSMLVGEGPDTAPVAPDTPADIPAGRTFERVWVIHHDAQATSPASFHFVVDRTFSGCASYASDCQRFGLAFCGGPAGGTCCWPGDACVVHVGGTRSGQGQCVPYSEAGWILPTVECPGTDPLRTWQQERWEALGEPDPPPAATACMVVYDETWGTPDSASSCELVPAEWLLPDENFGLFTYESQCFTDGSDAWLLHY